MRTETRHGLAGTIFAVGVVALAAWAILIAPVEVTANENTPATGVPTISGTLELGETLTIDFTGIADEDGMENAVLSYWLLGNYKEEGSPATLLAAAPISYAAGSVSYTVLWDAVGTKITAVVEFTDDAGNSERVVSASTAKVPGALLKDFTIVDTTDQSDVVTLTEFHGQEITLEDPANGSYGIRLNVEEDTEIGSVTLILNNTRNAPLRVYRTVNMAPYSLHGTDANGLVGNGLVPGEHTLDAYSFSESDRGGDRLDVLTVRFTVVPSNMPATGTPTISGEARGGQTLTADTSGIADGDGLTNVAYSYQWISNDGATDTEIVNATGSTYTLQSAEVGKTVKVRVNFTDDEGNEESLTSEATAEIVSETAATGAPTIKGTAQVGATLTADVSGIADADGLTNVSYSYQWLTQFTVEDIEAQIIGATASTFTVPFGYLSNSIKVRVTFTDDAGNDESLTSKATAAVVLGGL